MEKPLKVATGKRLVFDSALDTDGELGIVLEYCGREGGDEEIWIGREEAVKVVEHLKSVFGI